MTYSSVSSLLLLPRLREVRIFVYPQDLTRVGCRSGRDKDAIKTLALDCGRGCAGS